MIKFGIIGTNFISEWFAQAARLVDEISISCVYSRTHEKALAFLEKTNLNAEIYTDLSQLLSSDAQAIYIASPNFLHYEQARLAIESGKHVLIEKPACVCEQQMQHLIELARRHNVAIMEAMRPAHDPAMLEAARLIKEGAIGTIRHASIEYCQYSSRYDKFKNGEILNAFVPTLGNAAVMDIGVYALHAAIMFFGEPYEVCSKSLIFQNGMEGCGSVLLKYESLPVTIQYSKITESVCPSVIYGEDGYITIKRLSSVDEIIVTHRESGAVRAITADGSRSHGNMVYELYDFLKIIKGQLSPDSFLQNTLATLRVIDKIREQNGISFD